MKKRKGVSELLSYVMLIGMVITLSIAVSYWIYTQAKNPPTMTDPCEGVSITAEDIKCIDSTINAKLINSGRFTIDYVIVRVDNEERDVLRYTLKEFPLSLNPEESGEYQSQPLGTSPLDTTTSPLDTTLNQIKFIPVVNNRMTYCADQITYSFVCV